MALPTMYPGAVDVTSRSSAIPKVPYGGKVWVGGSGKAKLIIHTIEAADPDTIGWPRNWSGWTVAPHLAMNSDRYPDGDWLYQTVPFYRAGYALRLNAGEDDKFVYQIEVAGQAKNVSSYPDSFYQALGEVCQWFVDNMDVAPEFMDFTRCSYGTTSDGRVTQAEMDQFSGFAGHCHFGRGTDTHGDPGNLDIERLRSFMAPTDTSGVSNPAFQAAWDKAIAAGVFTKWTKPQDATTNERLAVFFDRFGLFDATPDHDHDSTYAAIDHEHPHVHTFTGETGASI